jgi:hypothetical protein
MISAERIAELQLVAECADYGATVTELLNEIEALQKAAAMLLDCSIRHHDKIDCCYAAESELLELLARHQKKE